MAAAGSNRETSHDHSVHWMMLCKRSVVNVAFILLFFIHYRLKLIPELCCNNVKSQLWLLLQLNILIQSEQPLLEEVETAV